MMLCNHGKFYLFIIIIIIIKKHTIHEALD